MEGQHSKVDVLTFDLFTRLSALKEPFIKHGKSFEKRLRTIMLSHHVILFTDIEAHPTRLEVVGFITECKSNKVKTRWPR
jgi:hypothetical protein